MNDIIFEGRENETGCENNCYCKIWKQGHSFKCKDKQGNRLRTSIRYWKPNPSIYSSLLENCTTCSCSTNERLKKMRETFNIPRRRTSHE